MPFNFRLLSICCTLFAWIGAFLTLQPIFLSHRRLFFNTWFDIHAVTIALALFAFVFAVTGWLLARIGRKVRLPVAIVVLSLATLALSTEILLTGYPSSDAERASWTGRNWELLRSLRRWLEVFGSLGLGVGGTWFAFRTWRMGQPSKYIWRGAGIVYIAASAVFVAAAFAFFAITAQNEFVDRAAWDMTLRETLLHVSLAGTVFGAMLSCIAISIHGIALTLMRLAPKPRPA